MMMKAATSLLTFGSLLLALPPAVVAASSSNSAAGPKPYVSSDKLQELVDIDDLVAGAQVLQDIADAHGGTREFGGSGHNATADYLTNELKALGDYYHVSQQTFTGIYYNMSGNVTFDGRLMQIWPMAYTPPIDYTGPILMTANVGCNASDYPKEAAGKVVLIPRGICRFGVKSQHARSVGAVGALFWNREAQPLFGILDDPFGDDYAATAAIGNQDGLAIYNAMNSSEGAIITYKMDAVTELRTTVNVFAETRDGDHDNVLMLGGHSDSVAAGPGIQDDGSGTISLLTVAKALTHFTVKNAVRFAFWSGEEFQLLGSNFYLNSLNSSAGEIKKIRAYLNFDMIASPNFVYGVYDGDGQVFNYSAPAGSDIIENDFKAFFKSQGHTMVPFEFNMRSDYVAFLQSGIPAGGILTGADENKTEEQAALFGGVANAPYDANYHKIGDNFDNLNREAWLLNTKAMANALANYAMDFGNLPRPDPQQRKRDAELATAHLHMHNKRSLEGHGHNHGASCGGGGVQI